jgi:uncharacterized membrane protein YoaK (UPF0700 family)
MKAHKISLLNSVILISMSIWGYFSSENPSITALIPLFFGVLILLCYQGVKSENKIIAHIAVLLTLVVLLALFMPLKGAFGREDSMAIFRIIIMIVASALSMVAFVQSFIAARKNK